MTKRWRFMFLLRIRMQNTDLLCVSAPPFHGGLAQAGLNCRPCKMCGEVCGVLALPV